MIVSTNNLVTTTNSSTWTPTYITVGFILLLHSCQSVVIIIIILIISIFSGEFNINDLNPDHCFSSHSTCVTFRTRFHGKTMMMVMMTMKMPMRMMRMMTK